MFWSVKFITAEKAMIKHLLRDLYIRRSNLLGRRQENRDAISRMSWSRDRMSEYSFNLARSMVEFAYTNVPFYQESFREVGYENGALKNWDDFEKLPILTKTKLRDSIDNKSIFATDKRYKFSRASTTGSTGEPLTLYFDEEGIRQREINLRRLAYLFAMDCGVPITQLWRKKHKSPRDYLIEYLGIRMTIPVLDVDQAAHMAVDDRSLDAIIERVIGFRTGVLRGYVSALESIAERMAITGKTIPTLRNIIASAEALSENQWRRLESTFGCSVHNLYGGTEAPCLAVNIDASHEMSIFDDYYRLEVIEENATGQCIGQVGRILVTDFFMRGMPLIRYENGDLGEISTDLSDVYPFRSMVGVKGRINDRFILPSGKIVYSHLWHIFFRDLSCLKRFRITQIAKNRIDIELEPADLAALKEKIPALDRRISKSLGPEVKLNWSFVDHIPLDKGAKFRAVRSLVDPEVGHGRDQSF